MWSYVTPDGASTEEYGWQRGLVGGSNARLVERAVLLDATVEDAIFTLPAASEVGGTIWWFKRIDEPGSIFVAQVEVADSTDTIEGASSVDFPNQWGSLVLVSDGISTWLIQSSEGL